MPVSKTPGGTSSSGGWLPIGAATLHEALASNDNGTSYVVCLDGSSATLALDAADNPNELGGHTLTVRCQKAVDLAQTVLLRAELMEGASVRATLDITAASSWSDETYTLSEAEAASITDYAALSVKLTDIDTPLLAESQVTYVELALPDRRLRVHCCG